MFLEGYEVGELIGESQHNTVRRARRLRDDARVIIKTSNHDYPTSRDLQRLEFEYHILSKLQLPGVIEALDIERSAGRGALILEDFGGERLPTRPGKGLPLDRFFPLAIGIAQALAQVHAKDIIHKDVNPRNVLMNPVTLTVKLIDFSLASELEREHTDAIPCTDLEGTLPYLSPEQTGRMNRDLDYRTDYYSLGVTLFELLTGSRPFSAPDVLGYVHCHLSKQPPSARERNPSVPEGLALVIAKLMAKNPDERYQSGRGLLHDLTHCQSSWTATGDVPSFELGRQDVSERFQVSQVLVGRSEATSNLLAAFEAASQGPALLLLVAGYSGIGKTSLIREIHKSVVDKRASFISGKFEQLERNTPYGALVQALSGFLKQLLRETEEQLLAHRNRFETALGNNANVLIPLLPELGQIMGAQPPVAELPAREAQGRAQRTFRDFLGAIATEAHPLVIFLDDLQWTDGSTPQLLVRLLAEENLKHVLFIGAYRNNEVSEGHLLRSALAELEKKRKTAVREVLLQPLPESALSQIVARTLHTSIERCAPIARLLFEKTGGNPFFTSELLRVLHRRGGIWFDADSGQWHFDTELIASSEVSDNVVDLMLTELAQLPADTTKLLRLAACLGNEFDIAMLSRIAERSIGSTAMALWRAVEQGLLLPKGDSARIARAHSLAPMADWAGGTYRYQFPHDRVMQAAYSLLNTDERASVHLNIGRLLRDETPAELRQHKVFDFVDHLNLGRHLLDSFEERAELATLNYAAARKARHSAAYATAVGYLETGEKLLSAQQWATLPKQRFEAARMRVECLFLSGRVESAASQCDDVLRLAPDKVSSAAAHCLKAAIQEQQSLLAEAVDTILSGLRELDVELPSDPALIEQGIGVGIGKLLEHLSHVEIEDLASLPVLTDQTRIATTELLFQLIPPASQMNPPLFILAELQLFDLALTHGIVPGSAKNFIDCGIVLGAILKDYARAYRMGKVAFTLLERQIPTPLEAAINFVFGCFISHWGAHFQEGLDALAQGYQRGVELGDTLHASYSIVHHAKSLLFSGTELSSCRTQTDLALAYTRETGAVGNAALPRIVNRALGQLQATNLDSVDVSLSDAEFTQEIEKTGNGHFLLVLGQTQTLVNFILGDFIGAEHWDQFATTYIGVGNGAFPVPDYALFRALIMCRKWRAAPVEDRDAIAASVEEQQSTLKTFADVCPANFGHKHKLVQTELARIRGASIDEVLTLHKQTVEATGDDFLHLRALSYELQADFWKDRGHPEFARECLLEAYHLYRHWGAQAKLVRMETEHRDWLRRAIGTSARRVKAAADTLVDTTVTTISGGNTSLDVASAIKASHAISSEVKPERLFAVLVQTIIENAGAEHGALIVRDDLTNELIVAAQATVAAAPMPVSQPCSLQDCRSVAQDLVRYVARTHETVVLDDAYADSPYRNDARIQTVRVKSVLSLPILNQGQLLAVLYIENNAVSCAFTPERLNLLRVIAGQAAISIANAQLYKHLEQKVTERTRQLAERNREVVAMLNSLEQGVFTIDDRLLIQPRYSTHLEQLLGTRQIAGQNCVDLVFADAHLSAETLDNMRVALEFTFGSSPIFADANRCHWVREFARKIPGSDEPRNFEVDWTPIPDGEDNVCKILVAIRDVTVVKQLTARAAQHARELDIVGQILDAGVGPFQRFCTCARENLQSHLNSIEAEVACAVEDTFRCLHSIKGNARLLGFNYLTNTVHLAEECFESKRHPLVLPVSRMAEAVGTVLAAIEEYEAVFGRKLGDAIRESVRPADDVSRAVAAQIEKARAGILEPERAISEIERLLEQADAVPLARIVGNCARALLVTSRETGKPEPTLDLVEPGVWVRPIWADTLRDCLIHIFQNSLAHGIETPDERVQCGKPECGRISVLALQNGLGMSLRLSDDGRGLALESIRRTSGVLAESDEETGERIFAPGITTADSLTTLAGRGVGLDVVRTRVRSLGGDVYLAFTGPAQNGYRPFELVFEIPSDASLALTSDLQAPGRSPSRIESNPPTSASRFGN